MNTIPTKEENPKGFQQRYNVSKIDGKPIDKGSEYFVLRLDSGGKDSKHILACRKAVLKYAEEIKDHIPQLSKDLIDKYRLGQIICGKRDKDGYCDTYMDGRKTNVRFLIFTEEEVKKLQGIEEKDRKIPKVKVHDLAMAMEGVGSNNSKEYCNCKDCIKLRERRDRIFNKWHHKLKRWFNKHS